MRGEKHVMRQKPEKHEKDERRKRLEEIVRSTEARKAEILSGGAGAGKGRLDGEWLEGKEEAAEKAREAVLAALRNGDVKGVFGGERESDESESGSEDEGSESEEEEVVGKSVKANGQSAQAPRKFFGWDEDEMSDSEEEDEEEEEEVAGEVEEPASEKQPVDTTDTAAEDTPASKRQTRSRGKAKA